MVEAAVVWTKNRAGRNVLHKVLERRYEVGLVEDDESVGPEQAGVVGAHLPRHPIPLEQEAGADHVDRPDDDRGRGRVREPLTVVHEPAAKRGDRKSAIRRQAESLLHGRIVLDEFPETNRDVRGLVDDSPAINDIDEAPWHVSATCPRHEPDGHDGCLAESRRDIDSSQSLPLQQTEEQVLLPREGRLSIRESERPAEPVSPRRRLRRRAVGRVRLHRRLSHRCF